jgi:single-stranded DNA-binding protein
MAGKRLNHGAGLHCRVTGTVVGTPMYKMVKNGTVPMLGLNMTYEEYDGTPSFCRVTLFGNRAEAAVKSVQSGQEITVGGTVRLNSWEKNGETKHGLSMIASTIETADQSDAGEAGHSRARGNAPGWTHPTIYDDGADLF